MTVRRHWFVAGLCLAVAVSACAVYTQRAAVKGEVMQLQARRQPAVMAPFARLNTTGFDSVIIYIEKPNFIFLAV
jgi:hypothetical protein